MFFYAYSKNSIYFITFKNIVKKSTFSGHNVLIKWINDSKNIHLILKPFYDEKNLFIINYYGNIIYARAT